MEIEDRVVVLASGDRGVVTAKESTNTGTDGEADFLLVRFDGAPWDVSVAADLVVLESDYPDTPEEEGDS